MATSKGDQHIIPTEARVTKFRFGEWHALGVSYGRQGQHIMLDGNIVASFPGRTQTFGQAGNHQEPLDIPTIGETVSHFWAHHRYEGGFEGILAAFRVSAKQKDWLLAQGIGNTSTATACTESEDDPATGVSGELSAGNPARFLDSRKSNTKLIVFRLRDQFTRVMVPEAWLQSGWNWKLYGDPKTANVTVCYAGYSDPVELRPGGPPLPSLVVMPGSFRAKGVGEMHLTPGF
jgi:hypothetical protein